MRMDFFLFSSLMDGLTKMVAFVVIVGLVWDSCAVSKMAFESAASKMTFESAVRESSLGVW